MNHLCRPVGETPRPHNSECAEEKKHLRAHTKRHHPQSGGRMNPADFDIVAKHVYTNVDRINRYLGQAKIGSKFLPNGTTPDPTDDLPGALLALSKEETAEQVKTANGFDPLERPNEDEIDTLFDAIRSRPSSGTNSNSTTTTNNNNAKAQRQGSCKKATGAAPLQQSRILNETNLIANTTTNANGSCSDLTGLINKTAKQPPIDVEALVEKLRQAIDLLGTIENSEITTVDLAQIRNQFRREWSSSVKACRNVDAWVEDFKRQSEGSHGSATVKKEPLITSELVKSMKQLQTKLHYALSVRKAEVLPDLTKTLSKEVFPLSEYLDMIDETIRQKQL
uniref:Uncharacterized protein n=1 Tax=Anopheles coluzzii TaxID=1518534 RepID=A0A8W7PBM5_ANOCL